MTTAGKFLCLLTLGVGFGAINTGNNLLFLLLGMMLSLILASGALSEAVLRKLNARRRLPARFVAGATAPGAYVIENPRSYSSLSVAVSDLRAVATAGPIRGQKVGPGTIPWWKVWKKPSTEPPLGSAYTMRIEPRSTDDVEARWLFEVRGRYRIDELSIVTRFPFGLFEKTRRIDDPVELTVYPAGLDASDWVSAVWSSFGEVPTNRRGQGDDYFGLRDYRSGEDMRGIHWKASARRGTLVIRENEALDQSEVEVVLCNWGAISNHQFELAVRKTVGLLGSLAARGWRIGLRTTNGVIDPDVGQSHLDRMLDELAVVRIESTRGVVPDEGPPRIAIGAPEALALVPAVVRLDARDIEDTDG